MLQPLYGGAAARPFITHHNALDMPLYLRIADELYLKRLIVGGFERVYEIGHDFRNEGMDRTHNPEFTMLEWYQAYADYHDMMLEMVEEMVRGAGAASAAASTTIERFGITLDFAPPYRRVRFVDGIRDACGLDVLTDARRLLRALAPRAGERRPSWSPRCRRGRLMDEVFKRRARAARWCSRPSCWTTRVELSPLAKPHRGDPRLAERFEFFVLGTGDGQRLQRAQRPRRPAAPLRGTGGQRAAGDEEAQQLDEDYVRALEYGMPPTGGSGVGIDRLVMLLAEQAPSAT